MSDDGLRLMNMSMDEAKKLRRAFGDAKYGCIRDVSFLAAAYIEAVDQSNYYDIALEQGQIDEETHAELQNLLLIGVLAPLRRVTPREM